MSADWWSEPIIAENVANNSDDDTNFFDAFLKFNFDRYTIHTKVVY